MERSNQSLAKRSVAGILAVLVALAVAVSISFSLAFADPDPDPGTDPATPDPVEVETLKDKAAEVDTNEVDKLDLNISKATAKSDGSDSSDFASKTAAREDGKAAAGTEMIDGVTYTITYPDGLTWGQKLTVVASVKMTKDGRLDENGKELRYRQIDIGSDPENPNWRYLVIAPNDPDYEKSDDDIIGTNAEYNGQTYEVKQIAKPHVRVYQAGDGRLAVSWSLTDHTEIEWTVTVQDSKGNEVGTPLLTGILDPDESNYLFDTNRSLFYVSAPYSSTTVTRDFGESFEVDDKGIYPLAWDAANNDYARDASGKPVRGAIGFDEGLILMSMADKGSFTWTTDTYQGGYLATPYFYSPIFRVTYDLDGGDGTGVNDPSNPDHYKAGESYDIKDPTRPGWVFIRWDRVDENGNPVPYDKIDDTDARDLHFIARWKRVNTYDIKKTRVLGVGETEEAQTKLIPGAPAYYLITLTNTGKVDIPAGLEVVDEPQANLEPQSATTESGSVEVKDGKTVWTVGTIPAGEKVQMWVTAKVPNSVDGDTVKNKATAHDPDDPDDPGKTDETEDPLYSFKIEKTANTSKAGIGDEITYTIKVYNESDYDAKQMIIQDELGEGLEYVSDNGKGTNEGKTTKWTMDLPAGTVTTITLTAKITKEPEGGKVENTAAIMDPNNPEKAMASAGTLAMDAASVEIANIIPDTGDFALPALLGVLVIAGAVVLLTRRRLAE